MYAQAGGAHRSRRDVQQEDAAEIGRHKDSKDFNTKMGVESISRRHRAFTPHQLHIVLVKSHIFDCASNCYIGTLMFTTSRI